MTQKSDSLEARIRERASCDPAFRARLSRDPAAAVADALGVDLADGVQIRVVEKARGEVVLVLPAELEGHGGA